MVTQSSYKPTSYCYFTLSEQCKTAGQSWWLCISFDKYHRNICQERNTSTFL